VWSGRTADARGAKLAVVAGLLAAAGSGLLYLLSLAVVGTPGISISVLLAGRAVLGGAESFIITGAIAWGLSRVGVQNAGKVIAWMGTAMFAAFAGGAPLGAALYDIGGFAAVALATILAPLATLALIALLRGTVPATRARPDLLPVVRQIWLPGLGAALASIGFGTVITFAALLCVERGWEPVWLPFTAYAVALIAARLLFGHLPDVIGGAKVALWCVLIETAGLATMGLANSAGVATFGALLVGFGYSLVFPGFGVEAVRRAPPESRGFAMGAYNACLDLALGVAGPVLGFIADGVGLGSAFLASAALVLGAAIVGMHLLRAPPSHHAPQPKS
jgi:MFS family permease